MTIAPVTSSRGYTLPERTPSGLRAGVLRLVAWLSREESGGWRYLAAALVVVLGVAIAEALLLGLHLSRVSVVLLAAVVVAATWLGGRPAIFAAGFAFMAQNLFLLQPAMQSRMDSREQILTLTLFCLVALMTGSLAGRMRDAARRAIALADMNTTLFEASRRMSATDEELELRRIVLEEVERLTAGPVKLAQAGEVALAAGVGWRTYSIKTQAEELGLLQWRAGTHGGRENVDETISVLADMCASSIARARLASHRSKLEIAAQSERLQTALLSSISHDFRTPLAAILASASSLQAYGEKFSPDTRADLATTIQEEAERLNRYVANLLTMTRLDSGGFKPERAVFDVSEVIDRNVRSAQRAVSEKEVSVAIADVARSAVGDPVLFELALQNVVENALRFAAQDVWIRCDVEDGMFVARIVDDGPGAPPEEVGHIFDRFFTSARQHPGPKGTGLGLSITRGVMEAMAGAADATAGPDGKGLSVALRLPRAAP